MKRFYLVLTFLFLSVFISMAQVPQAFKYQAIARDDAGNILSVRQIGLKVNILQGDRNGPIVYSEHHTVMTNEFGLIMVDVGKGESKTGRFSDISWDSGSHYLSIEMDANGGTNFTLIGASELLSVPYALYSGSSGTGGTRSGEWDNNASSNVYLSTTCAGYNVGVGTTLPVGKLHVQGNGFASPNEGLLKVEHSVGYTSTFRRVVNNAGNALFLLQKARGTITTPSSVLLGDNVGMIRMEAYDGSAYVETGWVRSAVDGTPATGSIPGNLIFATTTSGSAASEKMRITSTGNVGLGITNPAHTLSVIGTGYFSGNVGIGYTNPTCALAVSGSIAIGTTSSPNGYLTLGNSGVYLRQGPGNTLRFKDPNVPVELTLAQLAYDEYSDGGESRTKNRRLGNTDNYDLDLLTNGSMRLHINRGGNIGIGTGNPSEYVHIYQTTTTTNPKLLIENPGNGDASMRYQRAANRNFTAGLDQNNDDNFEISDTTVLTGAGATDYTDANTMMRINRTNAGIMDINHQSRARAYLSDTTLFTMPLVFYADNYGRPWFPIPFDKKTPQFRPGFDEHNELTLGQASPPYSFFTAKEEGYYQINARAEIYTSETYYEGGHNPPWAPVILSIGIFVNGQLYAQGNNYQLNYMFLNGLDMYWHWLDYMNAPNVSDVIWLNGSTDYVEIAIMIFCPACGPPYSFEILGNDQGFFTYVSIHKVS